MRQSQTSFGLCALALTLVVGCGVAEIDASLVNPGSVLGAKPFTLRENGEPVTGTVVLRSKNGVLLEEIEYRDGFPNGSSKEWFDNGQPKSEKTLRYESRGAQGGSVVAVGSSKLWCDNGTLRSLSVRAEDGVTGTNEVWNCAGQPLSYQTLPFGESRSYSEIIGSEQTVLTMEGTTAEGGGWVGVHKLYHQSGQPRQEEHWQDGALDGAFVRWAEDGEIQEQGTYAMGQKVGTWTLVSHGNTLTTEYDASKFMDPKYAQPFMAAIGLQPGRPQWPLADRPIDEAKARYYLAEALVDINKPINLTQQASGQPFATTRWTYPYVEASPRALDLLVELGADPKDADSGGHTRLHYCMYSMGSDKLCSAAEVQRLLDVGLDPNQANFMGDTPLHEVIKPHPYSGSVVTNEKKLEIARVLIAGGADPDALNSEGKTPLMLAVFARQFPLAQELLAHSKEPTRTDKRGLNLIHAAFFVEVANQFQLGLTEEISQFIESARDKGVDAQQAIGDMGTLKQIAEQSGAIELAQYLAKLAPS